MTNSPSGLIVFFLMVAAYRAEKKAVAMMVAAYRAKKKAVAVIERGLGFCNVCELRRQAQAIFFRRRHQPKRPPIFAIGGAEDAAPANHLPC
jgi:hypothetical protein